MKRTLFVLVLATLGASLPAMAGSVDIQLKGVGGANQGGVYVAPYYLSINGGPSIPVICDDFSHEVTIGEGWKGHISTFADLSTTRFGSADTQQYDEAAWLFTKFEANPGQAGDINFALWALFTPSATGSSGYTAGAATWYSDALNWYAAGGENSFNFSGFEIITPDNLTGSDSPQEFISYSPTPEPSTLLLLGTGLLGLGSFGRKRFSSLSKTSVRS
ncbi:MAG TPA: PEP-CTERM sorting domain-containing protein [Candidatus Acidoferrales bacterium]|nr:PEP-CTERM sorting domain-containing protein [Candidatus Acidoferrales bacterium]